MVPPAIEFGEFLFIQVPQVVMPNLGRAALMQFEAAWMGQHDLRLSAKPRELFLRKKRMDSNNSVRS